MSSWARRVGGHAIARRVSRARVASSSCRSLNVVTGQVSSRSPEPLSPPHHGRHTEAGRVRGHMDASARARSRPPRTWGIHRCRRRLHRQLQPTRLVPLDGQDVDPATLNKARRGRTKGRSRRAYSDPGRGSSLDQVLGRFWLEARHPNVRAATPTPIEHLTHAQVRESRYAWTSVVTGSGLYCAADTSAPPFEPVHRQGLVHDMAAAWQERTPPCQRRRWNSG